jgi:hypothetical protein
MRPSGRLRPSWKKELSEAINATKGVVEDALTRRRDHSFAAEAELARLEGSIEALAAIRTVILASNPGAR